MTTVRLLVNAGPWLPVPPPDYGGIENVVATLVPELRAHGVDVTVATVRSSSVAADRVVTAFDDGQFPQLGAPYATVVGLALAHMTTVLDEIRGAAAVGRPYDLVHDHVEAVGPAVLAAAQQGSADGSPSAVPPVLQTLHWDLHRQEDFYATFDGRGRVWFAGVSDAQVARAHPNLRRQVVGAVPLATPLPRWEPVEPRGHLLTLGRMTPLKGYDVAARACRERGIPLVMAGPVGGLQDAAALEETIADPSHPAAANPDVRWFVERVLPWVDGEVVRWVGSVGGEAKDELLRTARAVLFPLQWEEPGATAVVESLSAGVPVVANARGVLPSLVDHGSTGWLAADDEELVGYLDRVDELDRTACRKVAEERFAPPVMAERYLGLYERVLTLAAR